MHDSTHHMIPDTVENESPLPLHWDHTPEPEIAKQDGPKYRDAQDIVGDDGILGAFAAAAHAFQTTATGGHGHYTPTDEGDGGAQGPSGSQPSTADAPIRCEYGTTVEETNTTEGTVEAESDAETVSTKTTLEDAGDAEVYVHHRVSGGQLRYLKSTLDRVATLYKVAYPQAMRAGLIHALYCYQAYRYRYDQSGVPMPHYVWRRLALRYDGKHVQKTANVWGPLVAAGILEVRHFRDGLCRRFVLDPEVALAFAQARGTTKTRYDAMTGKETRKISKTNLTYGKGHSWKEKSRFMYDVLSYWKGARCLANRPAMEAHLQVMREEADAAREAADAEGRALGRVKDALPWGPLQEAEQERFDDAKKAYRLARRAAESAARAYAQDDHCWGVACVQDMKPAEGYPEGIVEFTPAYEVQMVSGRLTFGGGGPQGLSRRGKAAFYSGIGDLVNYDFKESQTRKLIEEFEYAIAAGADLDKSVLTDYEGKDVLAERHGVSRDVFKQAEHAPKFGAGFPHHTFAAAWAMAKQEAYEKVQDHGWGRNDFRTWEERVARELRTMAGIAYDVAHDPTVPDLDDPEEIYALLKEVYGPMAKEIKKWRAWLVTDHWAANNTTGGNGRFVEGPCGFAFNPHAYDEKERGAKYATNRLQGGEALIVHHLTLLGAAYGYEVIANEHDGLVALGTIPEAAVEEARRLSGYRTAELEEKRFWKHSPVGLPTEDTNTTTDPEGDTPCASNPIPEAPAGWSTDSSAPMANATTPATARTASGSSAGKATTRTARQAVHRSGASASPTLPSFSTATSSTRSSGAASPASSTPSSPSGTRTSTAARARR